MPASPPVEVFPVNDCAQRAIEALLILMILAIPSAGGQEGIESIVHQFVFFARLGLSFIFGLGLCNLAYGRGANERRCSTFRRHFSRLYD
jgi:hypothetical protein